MSISRAKDLIMSLPENDGIRIQITTTILNALFVRRLNSHGHRTYKQKFGCSFI